MIQNAFSIKGLPRIRACLISTLFVISTPAFCFAQPDREQLQQVLQRIEDRVNGINPIWIEYALHRYYSPRCVKGMRESRSRFARELDRHLDSEQAEEPEELRYVLNATFAAKDNKRHSSSVGPELQQGGRLTTNSRTRIDVFDGDLMTHLIGPRKKNGTTLYQITRANYSKLWGLPIVASPDKSTLHELNNALEHNQIAEIAFGHAAGGVQEITIRKVGGWSEKIWISTDGQCLLLKREFYRANGSLVHRVHDIEYERFEMIPVVVESTTTTYDKHENVFRRVRLIVSKVETDAEKIPESLFRLEIPDDDNVRVYDLDYKKWIR